MTTLCLRNVPDEFKDRLQRLADAAGMSVSAFAVRELTRVSARADNPALLGSLPHLGVDATDVVTEIEAGRR